MSKLYVVAHLCSDFSFHTEQQSSHSISIHRISFGLRPKPLWKNLLCMEEQPHRIWLLSILLSERELIFYAKIYESYKS